MLPEIQKVIFRAAHIMPLFSSYISFQIAGTILSLKIEFKEKTYGMQLRVWFLRFGLMRDL